MGETLRSAWARTELGRFLVVASERGLVHVGLRPSTALAELERWTARKAAGARVCSDPTRLAPAIGELEAWARGELREFGLALDLRGTGFQRACWAELLRIPYGTTITYRELARRVGRPPGASRAVGQANGANPVPIVVPCHRVVAVDGLGGFGGGLELKRRMLELEGALLPMG